MQAFGRELPENAAKDAVLESFSNFSEKLYLINAIKSENLGIWGYAAKFFDSLSTRYFGIFSALGGALELQGFGLRGRG